MSVGAVRLERTPHGGVRLIVGELVIEPPRRRRRARRAPAAPAEPELTPDERDAWLRELLAKRG